MTSKGGTPSSDHFEYLQSRICLLMSAWFDYTREDDRVPDSKCDSFIKMTVLIDEMKERLDLMRNGNDSSESSQPIPTCGISNTKDCLMCAFDPPQEPTLQSVASAFHLHHVQGFSKQAHQIVQGGSTRLAVFTAATLLAGRLWSRVCMNRMTAEAHADLGEHAMAEVAHQRANAYLMAWEEMIAVLRDLELLKRM